MSAQPSGFVLLHFGPMGVTAMSKASQLAGKDAVIDPGAARMAGASFALGDAALLDALKARLAAGAQVEAKATHPDLPWEAQEWLATGERGMSSEAILGNLMGISLDDDMTTIRAIPPTCAAAGSCSRPCRFSTSASTTWLRSPSPGRLVAAWDVICAKMDAEVPEWRGTRWSAPETYELMRTVLRG